MGWALWCEPASSVFCFLGPGFGLAGWRWLRGAGLGQQESPLLPYPLGSEQGQAGSGVRRLGLSLGLTLQPELPEALWEMRPAGAPR